MVTLKSNSMAAHLRWPTALNTLVFLVAYLSLYWMGEPLFSDPDVPWHIAAGDLILKNGALPHADPWSFTAGEQPWYLISWLWDIILSFVQSVAGTPGIYVLTLLTIAFLAALLADNIRQRGSIKGDALIFTLILAGLGMASYAVARPQLIGYLCLLLFHRKLHDSREQGPRVLIWLPVLMILWVNSHGSFIAGFALLGAYGLEAIISRRWQWLKELVMIGATCAVAALLNPYGIAMFTAVSRTLHSAVTQSIQEWMPFVFGNYMGLSAWVLIFIASSGLRDASIPAADKIISFLWCIAMLFSVRNGSIFVLVSAPYMALSLQRWVETLDSIVTRREDVVELLDRPGNARKLGLATAVIVTISVAMLPAFKGTGYLTYDDFNVAPAVAYVQKHYEGKRILNDYALGGNIIYFSNGELPVFVDGRAGTAYPEEVLIDYMKFLRLEEGWQQAIAKYRIDGMLLSNYLPFVTAYASGQYHGQWKQVYRDETATLFIRR